MGKKMTVATWFNPALGKKPPVLLHWRASKNYILFVVAFAVFTDLFLYGLIVPVAPNALQYRVGLPVEDEQRWTSILLALYGASLLAASPITGYLADRIESRQWPLLMGMVALAGGTALLTVGTNLGFWIAGRLLQGASTAVVWTAGLALLADTFNTDELGQSMGYVGMGMTLGLMAGPLVGGALYQHGGYYSVFGLCFGLIGLDILSRLVMIERKHALPWLEAQKDEASEYTQDRSEPLDNPSRVTETSPGEPFRSGDFTHVPGSENQVKDATLTASERLFGRLRKLLNSSRLTVAIWTYLVTAIVMTSFDSVLPLYVEETFNWAQTAQGLVFIPLSIPSLLDPVVGLVVDRWPMSTRYVCAAGLFFSVPTLVCLRFVTHNSMGQKVLLCALLVLTGVFIACFLLPPVMVEVSAVVKAKEAEQRDVFGQGGAMALAYGVLNSAFAAGTIIGPFFAGYIRNDAGWGTMSWALAILTGTTAVPILLFLGGAIWKTRRVDATTAADPAEGPA